LADAREGGLKNFGPTLGQLSVQTSQFSATERDRAQTKKAN
jgi:hypothetical protein